MASRGKKKKQHKQEIEHSRKCWIGFYDNVINGIKELHEKESKQDKLCGSDIQP